MTIKTITIAALSSAALFASTGAMAASSTQDKLELCQEAFAAQPTLAGDDVNFKFKSIRGGAVKKLTFEMRSGDERETVECAVKRGEVIDIAWTGGEGDQLASLSN